MGVLVDIQDRFEVLKGSSELEEASGLGALGAESSRSSTGPER